MIIPAELTGATPAAAIDPDRPLDVPPAHQCGFCGASSKDTPMRVAEWDTDTAGPLARCTDVRECTGRWIAKAQALFVEAEAAEAERARADATAAPSTPGNAAAASNPARGTPQKARTAATRPRPSRARKALTAAAPPDAAEEPVAPASGPSAAHPGPDGDAAA